MRDTCEGRVMSEGTSLKGSVPDVHGTPTPRPRIGAESGVAAHLSQHCSPHAAASEHATQTLQPRVSRHLAQQRAGSRERPRAPTPSTTTAPSRSVCGCTVAHCEGEAARNASCCCCCGGGGEGEDGSGWSNG